MIERTAGDVYFNEQERTLKAWVYEDGVWNYRQITEAELNKIDPLIQFDLSLFRERGVKC